MQSPEAPDEARFDWGEKMDTILQHINITALRALCSGFITAKNKAKVNRDELYRIIACQDGQTQGVFRNDIQKLLAFPERGKCKVGWITKRKLEDEEMRIRNVRAKLESMPSSKLIAQTKAVEDCNATTCDHVESRVEKLLKSDFMKCPTEGYLHNIVKDFIERTGKEATKTYVCCVCAQETDSLNINVVAKESIPHQELLVPASPHPMHDIIDSMLLDPRGLSDDRNEAHICNECIRDLGNNKTPPLSLANNMWIGEVPECLASLTLVERLLIAKYLPTAYVVKLFPKQAGAAHWDRSQLYSGFKGCVSTYELDPRLVMPMIDGKILPAPTAILSTTVAVTFITPSGKEQFSLPKLLYARRHRIREALIWLKTNNPLYHDIIISEERLQQIPENDVPNEIKSTARHSTAIDAVIREHEGYVPSDASEEIMADDIQDVGVQKDDPTIIPITVNGVVDVDGLRIPERELMAHALLNSISELGHQNNGHESADNFVDRYAYKRGSKYVNEYPRRRADGSEYEGDPESPNHLLGCFPTLFPFGRGGFETDRPLKVSYERHIKWALRYHDKRFRVHEQFPFQVFGVFQKRQICRSVQLQIHKPAFSQHRTLLRSLRPDDFRKASQEEAEGSRFSNEGIRVLRQHLRAVRGKVIGTDENRMSMRSKVWSTIVAFNPPSLWITINPSDQDPIAQVFAGADIDLDKFCSTAGPDAEHRGRNIASDPYASAQFFHFMIRTLLDVIFGIKKGRSGIQRRPGAFGVVQAYIGTVEAQGRGTLHLHMLLWLKDAPPASVMRNALKEESFRTRIQEYIKATIRADIDGRGTDDILKIPKKPSISYSRPIDPTSHPEDSQTEEHLLARSVQFHKCNVSTCLRTVNGRLECKRRAPFALSSSEWVDEDGEWGPKRVCPNLNSWNPWLMRTVRANHDAKLIMNGGETCVLVLYTTNYTFKKQNRSCNASALIANRLAYHQSTEDDNEDCQTHNKRMLQRCATSLLTEREFSGPEIMAYLAGSGDRFESHRYVNIYLDGAMRALKATFPGLINGQWNGTGEAPIVSEIYNLCEINGQDDTSTITVGETYIELKDQLRDYQFRGEELQKFSFYEFILNTYEDDLRGSNTADEIPVVQTCGKSKSKRIPYMPEIEKPHKCRVVRREGHEMLVRFIGRWFPKQDAADELYSASILFLLQPWRCFHDLKAGTGSFSQNLAQFTRSANEKTLDIIENIQYQHDCWDVAQRRRDAFRTGKVFRLFDYERGSMDGMDNDVYSEGEQDEENVVSAADYESVSIQETDIEEARLQQSTRRDRLFAEHAMQIAHNAHIFNDYSTAIHGPRKLPRQANTDDMRVIDHWDRTLKTITRKQGDEEGQTSIKTLHRYFNRVETDPTIEPCQLGIAGPSKITNTAQSHLFPNTTVSSRPKMDMLNDDQKKVHSFIERRIFGDEKDKGQLLAIIIGKGGTGKSVLIDAIAETFKFHEQENGLAKCATSGIASAHIGGMTVHFWGGLGINRLKSVYSNNPKINIRRKKNILGKTCLIIDEMSMLHDTLLADLAKVVAHVKKSGDEGDPHLPFGGMHVILMGDFHQFPPVAKTLSALYSRQMTNDSDALQGRNLYDQFRTVFSLEQQIRVKDPTWIDILDRLRIGECNAQDLHIIRGLILNSPRCPPTDFQHLPWSEAILITTRHTVRESWNAACLNRHCQRTGNTRYIVPAEDYIKGTGSPPTNDVRQEIARTKERLTGKLSDRIEIAVGMKAMIKYNISTEGDVANGTRGTIEEIILDPREDAPNADDGGVVTLKYPPAVILFKADGASDISSAFEDRRGKKSIPIHKGLVPISPSTTDFTITMANGKMFRISRHQYAITGGYAFTDFKSQGQSIDPVLVDIRNPPTGKLSPFSAYVALSRSQGRDSIRLLSDFEDELFQTHPNIDLAIEMDRLRALEQKTRAAY